MAPADDLDTQFLALAHPARRRMLRLIGTRPAAAGEIAEAVGLSGPATSQHLKTLRRAGLATVRVEGTSRIYSADLSALNGVRAFLEEFWVPKLASLKARIEAAEAAGRKARDEAG